MRNFFLSHINCLCTGQSRSINARTVYGTGFTLTGYRKTVNPTYSHCKKLQQKLQQIFVKIGKFFRIVFFNFLKTRIFGFFGYSGTGTIFIPVLDYTCTGTGTRYGHKYLGSDTGMIFEPVHKPGRLAAGRE